MNSELELLSEIEEEYQQFSKKLKELIFNISFKFDSLTVEELVIEIKKVKEEYKNYYSNIACTLLYNKTETAFKKFNTIGFVSTAKNSQNFLLKVAVVAFLALFISTIWVLLNNAFKEYERKKIG